MSGNAKDINKLIKSLKKLGVEIRDGKHWIVYPPIGDPISIPKTPSSRHALKVAKRRLRNGGIKVA